MENKAPYSGILQKNINWICNNSNVHICVHDTSGILQNNPTLRLVNENKIHSSKFCDLAKTTCTGLRFCLKCKKYSIKKAINEKKIYIGNCYLGITEIVKPVFWNKKLACIIYIGNIINESELEFVQNKIRKICKITGIREEILLDNLCTVQMVENDIMKQYKDIVDIIEYIVQQEISKGVKFNKYNHSINPIKKIGKHWAVEGVENYVYAYYDKNLRLSDIAKLYYINPQYMCRLFKKETGKTFSEYINSVRIEKAKKYLYMTHDTITSIALQVGFNNVCYFNKLFKQEEGVSPGEYRRIKHN